ncbi:MAG: type I restriction endonuclease subunit R [Clostridia bacterium]|jgi:type I restriction enzyme R subunit|nr:type I restriction endonuclease subunit R [Clostridia bacterium]
MSDIKFTESSLEIAVIEQLQELGYDYAIDTDQWCLSRALDSFINEELLLERLMAINPGVKISVLEQAISRLKNLDNPSLFERNHIVHRWLTDGMQVEDYESDVNPLVRFLDFTHPDNNVFQVANQLKFKENRNIRIPDVIIFVNGIPLVVFELKSIEYNEDTFIERAYEQLGRNGESDGYRYDIPTLFNYNAFLVISDGANNKVGTLTSDITRYNEWKSVDGEIGYKKNYAYKLDVLLEGLLKPARLLDVIKNNLFFMNKDKEKPIKILSQYHQYFGVKKAYESIKKNLKPAGSGKAGIVWHTQGSGKSFSMVMLAHKLITDIEMRNPTVVILTDRNDLDNQLYTTFSNAAEFLRTRPVQVESREDLLAKIGAVKEGGIIFTTLQKFDKANIVPNNRSNIVVISDEAHRSHYGIDEKIVLKENPDGTYSSYSKYGYAKYIRDALPEATYIGFTGTPVESGDHSTSAIFGETVDTYDMTQSVEDGSTVKIFYESRLAKVWLDDGKLKEIDAYYDDLAQQGVSDDIIEESKSKLSSMEVIIGDKDRLRLLATDILAHYDERKDILSGKAMIVCMSRDIAYKLYKELVAQAPEKESEIAVIVTESNKDTDEKRELFKDKAYRENMAKEFKKKDGSIKIVIVVDMWLTGFDVTDLDVMYIDKPMKGHNLMQAIARVNRVHVGKESGLIVDYIGIKRSLEEALNIYTARDKELNLRDIQETAKSILDEKLSILDELFYKVDKKGFFGGSNSVRLKAIQNGADFVFTTEDIKKAYLQITKQLKDAYAVAIGILDADYKKKVLYYLAVRHFVQKVERGNMPHNITPESINKHVADLIAEAIKGDEVKILTKVEDTEENRDIWDLLSEEKVEKLRQSQPPHVFIKIMERLLKEAVKEYRGYNLVKAKEYSERLRKLLEAYNTREDDLKTDITIVGLIAFSQEMVESEEYAKKNNLTGRERAFYDALVANKSAMELMSDDILRVMAIELKAIVEEYATVDWSKKKDTRAKMRMQIKRLLKKYNYPPEYSEEAISRVVDQAEFMM